MINILKDGYKKTFYHKCSNCATDFSYTVEDTRKEEKPYLHKTKVVNCPRCGDKQIAFFNENQENAFGGNPIEYGLQNCCCCDTNEESVVDE